MLLYIRYSCVDHRVDQCVMGRVPRAPLSVVLSKIYYAHPVAKELQDATREVTLAVLLLRPDSCLSLHPTSRCLEKSLLVRGYM